MDSGKQNDQVKAHISALGDGECGLHEWQSTVSALELPENRQEWEIYHQIGDILNSQELALDLSSEFRSTLQARLDAEPIHLKRSGQLPGYFNSKIAYAAAAMVALVAVIVPRFAGREGAEVDAPYQSVLSFTARNAAQANPSLITAGTSQNVARPSQQYQDAESGRQMLRDPLIDSYLAAHQRYSNSIYSAVEYETSPISQEAGK